MENTPTSKQVSRFGSWVRSHLLILLFGAVAIGALVLAVYGTRKAVMEPALKAGHGRSVDEDGPYVESPYDTTDDMSEPGYKPSRSPLALPGAPLASSIPRDQEQPERDSGEAGTKFGINPPTTVVDDKLSVDTPTKFDFTYYVIALRLPGDKSEVVMRDCAGNVLQTVSRKFLAEAQMEGTARFTNVKDLSVTVNISDKNCWQVLSYEERWGLGVTNPATKKSFQLRPFRSIAIDRKLLVMGAWYYVSELDGVQMPYPASNVKHDGCVRAMDVGPAIKGKHIDFYAAYLSAFETLIHGPETSMKNRETVSLYSGRVKCALHIQRGW